MDTKILKTFEIGIYYNPANSHYGGKGQVNCDRCMRTNIPVCIGFEDTDLCVKCVDLMSNTNHQNNFKIPRDDIKRPTHDIIRMPLPYQTHPNDRQINDVVTMPSPYCYPPNNNKRSPGNVVSFMEQSFYKKNDKQSNFSLNQFNE